MPAITDLSGSLSDEELERLQTILLDRVDEDAVSAASISHESSAELSRLEEIKRSLATDIETPAAGGRLFSRRLIAALDSRAYVSPFFPYYPAGHRSMFGTSI